MEITQHLYLKIGSNVRGPVSANVLHRMFKNKEIDSSAMFSFDGNKWASVAKLFSARTAVKSSSDSGKSNKDNKKVKVVDISGSMNEIGKFRDRVDRAAGILDKSFSVMAYLVFAGASAAISMLISLALRLAIPEFGSLLHIAAAVVPAVLLGAVAAHWFGNYYMRFLTGLSVTDKYSLAIHVPWENAPASWPLALKKWLYCNDWLVDNNSGDLLPYVRAFVTGKTPDNVNDEVMLWQRIMQGSRKRADSVVGHSVRELACLERLPVWTSEITPGMNLQELEKSLGAAGRKWALGLLKRAASRRDDLKEAALSGDLDSVIFEFFCNRLEDGRECLLVIISAHAGSDSNSRKHGRQDKERAA